VQPVWIHIPNEPGELVTDIWFRHAESYHDLALLVRNPSNRVPAQNRLLTPSTNQFKTSRNRVTQISPLFLQPERRFDWFKLCGSLDGPTKMYLNHSVRGVHHLAIENMKSEPTVVAPELVPEVSTRNFFGRLSWFYTKAPLSCVSEIIPCRWQQSKHSEDDPSPPRPGIRIENRYSPITGLLLRYSDGSRACVGEFRLDYACLPPLVVGDAPRLYLGFTSKVQLHSYMAEIRLTRPTGLEESSLKWLEVDWTGELEWLFNYFACQVFHGDRASLRPG
jgi:hypothetical protein